MRTTLGRLRRVLRESLDWESYDEQLKVIIERQMCAGFRWKYEVVHPANHVVESEHGKEEHRS